MAPALRFARYHEIAAEAAARLIEGRGTDPLRAWNEEVIVASSGVAQTIAAEVVERVGGAAGLRLQTLETFAWRLLNDSGEFPRVASDAERRLAMRTAVRTIDHPILDSRGVPSMVERSYRDVRDSGLSLAEFRDRARSARSLRSADRTNLLARVWTDCESLIERVGAIDPADLLRRAATLVRDGAPVASQIVAGFYDMTGAQLDLVTTLAERGRISTIWIPVGGGEPYRFASGFVHAVATTVAVAEELALPIPTPKWSVGQHETKLIEIRETCRAIDELLRNGTTASEVGVVARALDPHDIHLFHQHARRFGFRMTASEDLPLTAHRIGRALVLLLRLHENGFPRGDVLEIVRAGFRTETRINADRADEETREERIAGGTSETLRRVRTRSLAVGDYIGVVAELESIAPPASALLRGGEWAALLQNLVGRFRLETDTDLAAAEQIDEIADLFRRADRTSARFESTAVIDAIEQAAVDQPQPDESLPTIWLGDVMKFRGRSFEHLFAVGMQEDVFPQRRIEDPLAPDSDRHILGIREIGDGRDEEQLLFQLLLDGARTAIRFTFAGTDGLGKVLRPSQLLKNFVIAERTEEREALLRDFGSAVSRLRGSAESVTQPRNHATARPPRRPLQLLARSGTRGVFDGYITDPSLRTRFVAALEVISPTQLEDFGECPQKFFLKHILGVKDIDQPDRELQINHRDKGKIDHEILEAFYRATTEKEIADAAHELPRLPAQLVRRLEVEIDRVFDGLEERSPSFNPTMRAMERRATKRILRDFVSADLSDLLAHDLLPRRFEYRFGAKYTDGADHPEPFIVAAAGTPLRIEGRIDRIDEGDGRFRIIDYKSGKATRHKDLGKKLDSGVRLQLALYAMAVAEFFAADPSSISAAIKPLVLGDANPDTFAFGLAEKRERLLQTLDLFARAIARGVFPAFPNENDREFNSCKYCPANNACRTKHDLEERYEVTRSSDPRTLLEGLL